jgi:membrane protein YqaA with SNARE-associated domain
MTYVSIFFHCFFYNLFFSIDSPYLDKVALSFESYNYILIVFISTFATLIAFSCNFLLSYKMQKFLPKRIEINKFIIDFVTLISPFAPFGNLMSCFVGFIHSYAYIRFISIVFIGKVLYFFIYINK